MQEICRYFPWLGDIRTVFFRRVFHLFTSLVKSKTARQIKLSLVIIHIPRGVVARPRHLVLQTRVNRVRSAATLFPQAIPAANRMQRKLYLIGLAILLVAAGAAFVYCLLLMGSGDPRGLVNVGKVLLVASYSAYRLRSVINGQYQISRPWESPQVTAVKRGLLGAMGICLALIACSALSALVVPDIATTSAAVLFPALLFIFLGLETVNALNPSPMIEYEPDR